MLSVNRQCPNLVSRIICSGTVGFPSGCNTTLINGLSSLLSTQSTLQHIHSLMAPASGAVRGPVSCSRTPGHFLWRSQVSNQEGSDYWMTRSTSRATLGSQKCELVAIILEFVDRSAA